MVLKSEHTHTHREQWEKGDTHTEMHTRRADARSTGGAKSGGAPTTTIWMTGWTLGVVREPEAKEGLGGGLAKEREVKGEIRDDGAE